ncbi:2-amino-4-hydroxy-6-hydroxymethyldihydropteridine diphosphokinase [Devosia sp. YR412]|uniref:2-amino-4-hydroxy-6- hydroxymethyldihydropteridine diphosphokinase n=1 Tax=Devosia sp. YR412 TaxID=1881030 RepID=UPI001FCD870E|nr:2-amino-4-hydroxy-6-hydroxymethyldihydropteridine diphosphokinase [Devosia sp. YR412]
MGANIGDPPAQLAEALRRIDAEEHVHITKRSSVIITKAWGKTDQPDFANMAIEVETSLKPLELLDVLQAIELAMGRVRKEVWGPRLIDIDILAYDQIEMISPRLTLPHPYAHEREFVLNPLAEISPSVNQWLTRRVHSAN